MSVAIFFSSRQLFLEYFPINALQLWESIHMDDLIIYKTENIFVLQ